MSGRPRVDWSFRLDKDHALSSYLTCLLHTCNVSEGYPRLRNACMNSALLSSKRVFVELMTMKRVISALMKAFFTVSG